MSASYHKYFHIFCCSVNRNTESIPSRDQENLGKANTNPANWVPRTYPTTSNNVQWKVLPSPPSLRHFTVFLQFFFDIVTEKFTVKLMSSQVAVGVFCTVHYTIL
jgi:hypothetical protein